MERLKVGIAMKDGSFAAALVRGLSREAGNMLFTILCEPWKTENFNLVLTDFEADEISDAGLNEGECIRLTSAEEGEDAEDIFKYEDCRTLVNRMIYIFYERTGRVAEYRGNSSYRVIVFGQVSGGCGATSAALGTAAMLGTIYGARCLYLNLCPFDDSKRYIEESHKEGLVRLLYHLHRDEDFPLESFIGESEFVDSFMTGVINKYALEMDGVMFNRLLKAVERLGRYDYFIVDVGNFLHRTNLKLLEAADCLVLLCREEAGQRPAYMDRIYEEIEQRTGKSLIKVVNFADEYDEGLGISVDHSAFVKMGGRVKIDINGNYGLEVAAVAREIAGVCNGRNAHEAGM